MYTRDYVPEVKWPEHVVTICLCLGQKLSAGSSPNEVEFFRFT
jgi:hypothetical protein